jgi:hypothetical protein
MSDQSPRKTQPKNLKKWLSHLDNTSEEEDARRFLLGDKPKNLDINLEDTGHDVRSDLQESHRTDLFHRISARLRGSGLLPSIKKTPEETGPVTLEDDQVVKRLVGEATPETPVAKPLFGVFRARRRRTRSTSQPAQDLQGVQEDANRTPLKAEKTEIAEPNLDQLRATAIEGYDPDAPNKPGEKRAALARLRDWFGGLPLWQKMTFLVGTLVVLGLVIYGIVNVSSRLFVPVESTPYANLNPSAPIPSSVVLPDGQTFALGLGEVTHGSWTPKGAEWLVGTEVPRWLALPWNEGLESAVRAFKNNAPISLKMSNGDMLAYHFESIQEIPRDGMSTFRANTASLLIILSKPGASTRLVIFAGP